MPALPGRFAPRTRTSRHLLSHWDARMHTVRRGCMGTDHTCAPTTDHRWAKWHFNAWCERHVTSPPHEGDAPGHAPRAHRPTPPMHWGLQVRDRHVQVPAVHACDKKVTLS